MLKNFNFQKHIALAYRILPPSFSFSLSTNSISTGESSLTKFITNKATLSILEKRGIKELFPVQERTFDKIKSGKDFIISDRTGSGKTLAYCLPILERMRTEKSQNNFKKRKPKFLIMVPTRQLAVQVCSQMRSLNHFYDQFFIEAVYGGSNMVSQIQRLNRGNDIIIATPGRLIDLLERRVVDLSQLKVLCFDEADEMLNRGFKQDMQHIVENITTVRKNQDVLQTLMFSATIPEWVVQMSQKFMQADKQFINMISESGLQTKTSTTVKHYILEREDDSDVEIINIVKQVVQNFAPIGRTIVFAPTKKMVSDLGYQIQNCVTIHGDLSQNQRIYSLSQFSKHNKKNILVATDVAARGLDIQNVELVIQIGPPKTTDSYIHRSGRTGRMGKTGKCITIYSQQQRYLLNNIAKQAKITFFKLPNLLNNQTILSGLIQQLSSKKNYVSKNIKDVLEKLTQQTKLTKQQIALILLSKRLPSQFETSSSLYKSLLSKKIGYITYTIKPKLDQLGQKQLQSYLIALFCDKNNIINNNNLIYSIQCQHFFIDVAQKNQEIFLEKLSQLQDKFVVYKSTIQDVILPQSFQQIDSRSMHGRSIDHDHRHRSSYGYRSQNQYDNGKRQYRGYRNNNSQYRQQRRGNKLFKQIGSTLKRKYDNRNQQRRRYYDLQ